MCKDAIQFPDLLELNDYGGNYTAYEAALHQVYVADLWNSGLTFNGLPVIPRVHMKFVKNGKTLDWTFVHCTSAGPIEADRELDLRRCERIGWLKPIIENAHLDCVKLYENERVDDKGQSNKAVVLWCECASAKIVLTKKTGKQGDFYQVTTFYLVSKQHKIDSHNKEFDEYNKKFGEFKLVK